MSDTPIYDEVRAFLAARARQAYATQEAGSSWDAGAEPEPDDEPDVPIGCSWCGVPLDDVPDRLLLPVQDPVGGDDILLGACSAEHAEQLSRRYRVRA